MDDPLQERGLQVLAERLAEVAMRLEDHGPAGVEAWIEETLTPKETRELLMVAMIVITDKRMLGE